MKVSICIPAYKHVDFLKRCIDSVLSQTFTDFEIIVTDDSPDNSLEKLCRSYFDNRILYYKNTSPLGSPANWNEAIKKAQGDYIKMLHHDDWFADTKSLDVFVKMLDQNPYIDIAFSASCDIDKKGNKNIHRLNPKIVSKLDKKPLDIFLGNVIGAPSVGIFRNDKGYFYDENLIWAVDTDFYIRTIGKKSFGYSPEVLVNIGVSEQQITHSDLANYIVRVKEKIYLYNKFDLKNYESKYRRSLLRVLGREKVFSIKDLKIILPEENFIFSLSDKLWARYYYIKKIAGKYMGC